MATRASRFRTAHEAVDDATRLVVAGHGTAGEIGLVRQNIHRRHRYPLTATICSIAPARLAPLVIVERVTIGEAAATAAIRRTIEINMLEENNILEIPASQIRAYQKYNGK